MTELAEPSTQVFEGIFITQRKSLPEGLKAGSTYFATHPGTPALVTYVVYREKDADDPTIYEWEALPTSGSRSKTFSDASLVQIPIVHLIAALVIYTKAFTGKIHEIISAWNNFDPSQLDEDNQVRYDSYADQLKSDIRLQLTGPSETGEIDLTIETDLWSGIFLSFWPGDDANDSVKKTIENYLNS